MRNFGGSIFLHLMARRVEIWRALWFTKATYTQACREVTQHKIQGIGLDCVFLDNFLKLFVLLSSSLQSDQQSFTYAVVGCNWDDVCKMCQVLSTELRVMGSRATAAITKLSLNTVCWVNLAFTISTTPLWVMIKQSFCSRRKGNSWLRQERRKIAPRNNCCK